VIKEIREETNKFLESTENENTTYQYLWDTAKAMLRVMFMAISVYIKKPETSQIKKKLIICLSLVEIQEQTKPQSSRQGEIIKIRAELKRSRPQKLHKEPKNYTKNQ
jgi:hypothetical protein